MCGAVLVDSISLGPLLPNVGLFHIVYSSVLNKKGSINLSFTACRDMLPDPETYADCLQQAFEELRDGTLGAGGKATATRTTTRKKAKAGARGRAKAKAKAKVKAKAKAKAKTKTKTKTKVRAKAQPKARAKAKSKRSTAAGA